MNIQELKQKSSESLISDAEKLGIENASTLRRQEIYFAILKKLAEKGEEITGGGVLQLLNALNFFLLILVYSCLGFLIKILIIYILK